MRAILASSYHGYTDGVLEYSVLTTTHHQGFVAELGMHVYLLLDTHQPPPTTPHQVVLKELCVHDRETTQFNVFCNILITEFAYMRTKTAEDMELMRK